MRRNLVLCLVLLVGVAVGREGEQLVNELSELRADFDGGSTTGASPAEFAEALREVGRQKAPDVTRGNFPPPLYSQPAAARGNGAYESPVPPPATRDRVRVAPPQPYDVDRYSPPARPTVPPFPNPPERSSKHVLLRESAFELERIAHQLEMASLFAEADEVRSAAEKLRKAARVGAEKNRAAFRTQPQFAPVLQSGFLPDPGPTSEPSLVPSQRSDK